MSIADNAEKDMENFRNRQTMAERIGSNPLLGLGALGVVGSMVGGMIAFRNGNSKMSQLFQRSRVTFQFLTISYGLYVFKPWEAKTENDRWVGQRIKAEREAHEREEAEAAKH
jgi:hypothetical protein